MGPPKRIWLQWDKQNPLKTAVYWEEPKDSGFPEYVRSDILAQLEEELEGFRRVRQVLEDFESGSG